MTSQTSHPLCIQPRLSSCVKGLGHEIYASEPRRLAEGIVRARGQVTDVHHRDKETSDSLPEAAERDGTSGSLPHHAGEEIIDARFFT